MTLEESISKCQRVETFQLAYCMPIILVSPTWSR